MSKESVLEEVSQERLKQDAKFGTQNHPNLPKRFAGGNADWWAGVLGIRTAQRAKYACDTATAARDTNWSHVLVEEVAEVIEQAALNDAAKLRAELIQVAAVACHWVENIDLRQQEAAEKALQVKVK